MTDDAPRAAMNRIEIPHIFELAGDEMVGVATLPAAPMAPATLGVLMLVGGRQYRAGSHRQLVLLSRHLAGTGIGSFRFDFRGMGDSSGERRDFETLDDDIAAALAAFRAACPTLERVVLWGLCDGATAAVLYWQRHRDPMVAGLCLANPWLRSEASLARVRVRHYYRERLLDKTFWSKLLRGEIGLLSAAGEYLGNWRASRRPRQTPFGQAMIAGLTEFSGPVLLLLSGRDLTAREFMDGLAADPAGAAILNRGNLARVDLPEADHTFSDPGWRGDVERAVGGWLAEMGQSPPL